MFRKSYLQYPKSVELTRYSQDKDLKITNPAVSSELDQPLNLGGPDSSSYIAAYRGSSSYH
jgi:hypothetical protein